MNKTATAILVAAGSSSRMGFDKLAATLGKGTVLSQSVAAFDAHPRIDQIVLVHGQNKALAVAVANACTTPIVLVTGGKTRAESVAAGMVVATGDLVAIHDAARPFVSAALISEALLAAESCGAAAPAVPVKDTIKQAQNGAVVATPNRASLFAVQTPQCFDRNTYLRLLQAQPEADFTDDCQLFEAAGHPVQLTKGDYANRKITTPDDLPTQQQEEPTMRIGHGYDVHKLVQDRPLILGGVTIPFEKGLLGHSDADVLTHAVMDALLGGAALGDIGRHFPDADPTYKGADSLQLATVVAQLVQEAGCVVQNVDATILCQRPKLAPHIEAMRQNLAKALGLSVDCINVKATTEEGLGFTGQGQGIAVHAVALLQTVQG